MASSDAASLASAAPSEWPVRHTRQAKGSLCITSSTRPSARPRTLSQACRKPCRCAGTAISFSFKGQFWYLDYYAFVAIGLQQPLVEHAGAKLS